jgi:biotin carboxyl carrier protein
MMGEKTIKADIAGRVSALPLQVGASVKEGDDIAVVEAMKMEIPLASPANGRIKTILVAVDDVVEEGQAMFVIEV